MSMSSDIRGLVMTMGLLTRVMTTWLRTQIDWVSTGAAWASRAGPDSSGRALALPGTGPCPPSEASQPGSRLRPRVQQRAVSCQGPGMGSPAVTRQYTECVYLSRPGEPRSSQASEARTHSQLTEINSDPGPEPSWWSPPPTPGPRVSASHPMIAWPQCSEFFWLSEPPRPAVPGVTPVCPVPGKKPNVENETKMIHKGVDKDTTRLSAIIALSFIFTSQAGMWALHRRIKMRRRIHRNEAGGGFKVLHLLKVGYQTSQGEILARHKIRKIWWYDFPSFFYVDIKKIF